MAIRNLELALAAYTVSLHPDNDLHLSHLCVLKISHDAWNIALLQVVCAEQPFESGRDDSFDSWVFDSWFLKLNLLSLCLF